MRTVILFLSLVSAQAGGADNAAPMVAELSQLLVGEFDSRRQMHDDIATGVPRADVHGWVNRTFVAVDAPKVGNAVVVTTTSYNSSSWTFDKNEFLVWTLTLDEQGKRVVMSPKRFKDPQPRLPFSRDGEKLAGFSPDDLEAAIGGAACDIVWTPTENGFSGRSRPCRVMSTTKGKMLNWTWQFDLAEDALMIAFFGRDETGTALDGSPDNKPYRLDRIN